jgi:hypothetical protein
MGSFPIKKGSSIISGIFLQKVDNIFSAKALYNPSSIKDRIRVVQKRWGGATFVRIQ